MADSIIKSLNYDSSLEQQQDLIEFFRSFRQRMLDAVKREEEMAQSGEYEYTQVWLMSKEQFEKLPDNPTWYDYLLAGAVPQGYQWVKKDDTRL